VPRAEEENRAAQGKLLGRLEGLDILAALAEAQDGSWQEPSFFVIGIPRWEATELARDFGQLAFLAGEPGGVVELVSTRA
jgi:hypothetical protein